MPGLLHRAAIARLVVSVSTGLPGGCHGRNVVPRGIIDLSMPGRAAAC